MSDDAMKSEAPVSELANEPIEEAGNSVESGDPDEVRSDSPAVVTEDPRAASDEPVAETPGKSTDEPADSDVSEVSSGEPVGEPLVESPLDSAETSGEEEEEDDDEDLDVEPLEFIEETPEEEDISMDWYILKVQVNRENSICDALLRRVKIEGLERFFGDILVPTEDVREFTKTGKQRVVKRKLYPGYIVVRMAINDETWFVVRETPGIGDFTGSAGKPTPMLSHEIDRILKLTRPEVDDPDAVEKTNIRFKQGDRVRVKDGHFQNFEGEVDTIDETHGRVTVMINIFGRPTPVELEHWQVEEV